MSTRLIAGLIAIIPLYSLSVLAAFFAARFTTVFINNQSSGLYDHYFNTFLVPTDLLWSFLQAIVMAIAVMLVHTYYGYNASGGPVGVGIAVGQAVRTSLIVVVTITLFISLAVYGASGQLQPLPDRWGTMSDGDAKRSHVRIAAAILAALLLAAAVFTYLAYTAAFTSTDTVTVTSPRAGLVMERDAKVKYRGIQIGEVKSIDYTGDQAKLTLAIDSNELRYIPSNAVVRIAGTTFRGQVRGVRAPDQPEGTVRPGAHVEATSVRLESQHAVPDASPTCWARSTRSI